jgi:hypothetical protein
MHIAFDLAWWHVPLLVTVLLYLWSVLWPSDDWTGVARVFMVGSASLVSMIVWIVGGVLK